MKEVTWRLNKPRFLSSSILVVFRSVGSRTEMVMKDRQPGFHWNDVVS